MNVLPSMQVSKCNDTIMVRTNKVRQNERYGAMLKLTKLKGRLLVMSSPRFFLPNFQTALTWETVIPVKEKNT